MTFNMNDYMYSLKIKEHLCEFLIGHLALEQMMILLIRQSKTYMPSTFAAKNELLKQKRIITLEQYNLLYSINKIRNKFSHQLSFELTVEATSDLLKQSELANVDFSDVTIFEWPASTWYSHGDVLNEIFRNLVLELSAIYESNGSDIAY